MISPLARPLIVIAASLMIVPVASVLADQAIVGTPEDDFLSGTLHDDRIIALGGNDIIEGQDGDDVLSGGNGDDIIFGGPGADSFDCGRGVDAIVTYDSGEGDDKSDDCEPLGVILIDIDVFGPHDASDFGGTETTGINVINQFFAGIAVQASNSYSVRLAAESDGTATIGQTTYDINYSDGCSGSISEFETKTCTITATART